MLPTSGFGKSRGSLSVLDFIKIINKVELSRKGLEKVEPFLKEITFAEGLPNHYEAVRKELQMSWFSKRLAEISSLQAYVKPSSYLLGPLKLDANENLALTRIF